MKKYRMKPRRLSFISIVSDPANNTEAIKLSKQSLRSIDIISTNRDNKIIYGVVARPNYLMERVDGKNRYSIFFTKKDILDMFNLFKNDNGIILFDTEHNNRSIEVKVLDSYICSEINSFGVEDGSWILSLYIEDDYIWNLIKTDVINGFSPELDGEIIDYKETKNVMNKLTSARRTAVRKLAKLSNHQFSTVESGGYTLEYDSLDVGSDVFTETGETPPDGDYTIGSQIITISDGVITEKKEVEESLESLETTPEVESRLSSIEESLLSLQTQISQILDQLPNIEEFKQKLSKAVIDSKPKPIINNQLSKFNL